MYFKLFWSGVAVALASLWGGFGLQAYFGGPSCWQSTPLMITTALGISIGFVMVAKSFK
jgi:hypothetical protein